jgi:Rrf2 family protein
LSDGVGTSNRPRGGAAVDGCVMISQRAKYALRALAALAQADQDEPMLISEIAVQQSIPKKFLEQILLDLKRSGIVVSRRGKQGGYLLLKPADAITFGEVLRLVDGPIAPLPCLSQTAYRKCDDCDGEHLCEIRHVFARVADATRDVLFNTTIADAIEGAGEQNPAKVRELLTA